MDNNATIQNSRSNTYGGAVYVNSADAKFAMNDGSVIKDCFARWGGAIAVSYSSGGQVVIDGATAENGGVKITGNTGVFGGGAMYLGKSVSGKDDEIKGEVEISGNTGVSGGAIWVGYNTASTTLKLVGPTTNEKVLSITENYTTGTGSGAVLAQNGKVVLSGNVEITGNTKSDTDDTKKNLYEATTSSSTAGSNAGSRIEVGEGGLGEYANIGVYSNNNEELGERFAHTADVNGETSESKTFTDWKNFQKFKNDRATTDTLIAMPEATGNGIIWGDPICKVTEERADDTLVVTPFNKLQEAANYLKTVNSEYTIKSEDKGYVGTFALEMIKTTHTIHGDRDQYTVEFDGGARQVPITFTTGQIESELNDTYDIYPLTTSDGTKVTEAQTAVISQNEGATERMFSLSRVNMTLKDITLDGNNVNIGNSSKTQGSIIYATSDSNYEDGGTNLVLDDGATLTQAKNETAGGAVFLQVQGNVASTLTMKSGSEISKCSSGWLGGAVHSNGGDVTLEEGSLITECTAATQEGDDDCGGGAIYGKKVTVAGKVTKCEATNGRGGGVYAWGADTSITGEISECKAGVKGGGLYVSDSSSITNKAVITGNTAPEGGAVYSNDAVVKISGSDTKDEAVTITGNHSTSTSDTGAVATTTTGYFVFENNVVVSGNDNGSEDETTLIKRNVYDGSADDESVGSNIKVGAAGLGDDAEIYVYSTNYYGSGKVFAHTLDASGNPISSASSARKKNLANFLNDRNEDASGTVGGGTTVIWGGQEWLDLTIKLPSTDDVTNIGYDSAWIVLEIKNTTTGLVYRQPVQVDAETRTANIGVLVESDTDYELRLVDNNGSWRYVYDSATYEENDGADDNDQWEALTPATTSDAFAKLKIAVDGQLEPGRHVLTIQTKEKTNQWKDGQVGITNTYKKATE